MEIPGSLENNVKEGKVILFLGAGASKPSLNAKGNNAPNGNELRDLICDRFLGGKYKDQSLSQVSGYAINETDLRTVQDFIKQIFENLIPTVAHKKMCHFYWKALATTNYDLLVEKAYQDCRDAFQQPIPFIENGDNVEEGLRGSTSNIRYLKLHGCITRISNPDCPLILSNDQYIRNEKGRSNIFKQLSELACDYPIVFIGYQLQDYDLLRLLQELSTEMGPIRPRFYAILPNIDQVEIRYWEHEHKIALLKGTFEEFLDDLDKRIPKNTRKLANLLSGDTNDISERFTYKESVLSTSCKSFLDVDVEYVKYIKSKTIDPKIFYKGLPPSWAPIEQNLDVRRNLCDQILVDHFLINEEEHSKKMELILVKAYAGSGKSILLRRIAWEASHDYDHFCLYLKPHCYLNPSAVKELLSLTFGRLFLFIENIVEHYKEVDQLSRILGKDSGRLTIIASARTSEWNMLGSDLVNKVTQEYELKYLASNEIKNLLYLLEKNNSLYALESRTPEEREKTFQERAGRQLLVALYEATHGKTFEEIIENEYLNIVPEEARLIYLTVCVLNRLDVYVRAGIIARIHGVPFSEFKDRFFAPLENIVEIQENRIIGDSVYVARHPYIAQIVFERVLKSEEERFDHYLTCLAELNVDYSGDKRAFIQMVNHKSLNTLFKDHLKIKRIYETAFKIMGNDSRLLQQKALYEMNRENGNLNDAEGLLIQASKLSPSDLNISHSLAELKIRYADRAKTALEEEKYLNEAQDLAKNIKRHKYENTYGYHTLAKIYLRRLKKHLQDETTSDQIITSNIKELESCLLEGLQYNLNDSYLLDAEAKLAELLKDKKRVLDALEKAHSINPSQTFIAVRLCRWYESNNELEKACEVLRKSLAANPAERRLHYEYSRLLIRLSGDNSELLHHLKRSFTDGDDNFDAQILYGRTLFLTGNLIEAREHFKKLSERNVSQELKTKIVYPIDQEFFGKIGKKEVVYCFVVRDGDGEFIYSHISNFEKSLWESLQMGNRVKFKIGFTTRGPRAFDMEKV